MTKISTQDIRNLLNQAGIVRIQVKSPNVSSNLVINADDLYVTNDLNGLFGICDFNERIMLHKLQNAVCDNETGIIDLYSDYDYDFNRTVAHINILSWKED